MADDFHTWVVHYCSSLIMHGLKEHTVLSSKMVCNHCKSKTNCQWLSYVGGRWPMMSRRWGSCVGVHYCISVIIHKLKGLTAILSKIVCNHCTSTTQCPCSSYMGDRWPIMSRQSLMFLVPMSLIFMSGWGLEVTSINQQPNIKILFKCVLMTS